MPLISRLHTVRRGEGRQGEKKILFFQVYCSLFILFFCAIYRDIKYIYILYRPFFSLSSATNIQISVILGENLTGISRINGQEVKSHTNQYKILCDPSRINYFNISI